MFVASCQTPVEPTSDEIEAFGSNTRIDILGVPKPVAQAALTEIRTEMQTLHREWHAWEPGTLTALNADLAAGRSVVLTPLMRDITQRSLAMAATTGGLFDPSVGGLMQLWGFYTNEFPISSAPPSLKQITAWRESDPSFDDLLLTADGLQSRNPAVRLDFGAIVEGIATEHIVRILQRHGVKHALIAMGGDLHAIGNNGARPWQAELRDPFNQGGQPLATVDLLPGEAMYSSGSYNRYRESPTGTRWPQVVDPRSGLPAMGIVAVNVLHPDPVVADVASIALMVAGESGFTKVLQKLGVRCALLLTEHNELMMTAAMAERVRMQRDPLRLGPLTGTVGPCSEPEPRLN
ncbi:MAG: FAD:protein FMN transferase [Pseudomarimonas sp.]